MENKKGLFQVQETCHYKARYGEAMLPKLIARLLAIQAHQAANGEFVWDTWFNKQGLTGCAALARGDTAAVKAADDDQRVCARHCTIFKITDFETCWRVRSEPFWCSCLDAGFRERVEGDGECRGWGGVGGCPLEALSIKT